MVGTTGGIRMIKADDDFTDLQKIRELIPLAPGALVSRDGNGRVQVNQRALLAMQLRLVCVGCLQHSTAENSDLCTNCSSYIHEKCQKFVSYFEKAVALCDPDILSYSCPGCGSVIARREVW